MKTAHLSAPKKVILISMAIVSFMIQETLATESLLINKPGIRRQPFLPLSWSVLTSNQEQPSCEHLHHQLDVYLQALNERQNELLRNPDYRQHHRGSVISALQDSVMVHQSLSTVFDNRSVAFSAEIPMNHLPREISRVETLVLFARSSIDQFELGRFFHSPLELEDRGDRLRLEGLLTNIDICSNDSYLLLALWDCEQQEQGSFACVQDGTCQARRVLDPTTCQSGIEFALDTEPIRKALGIKNGAIGRRPR